MLPKKDKYASQRYQTTDQLAFKLDGWLDKEWKDGKQPLETQIQDILDHMETSARDLENNWVKREAERRQEAKAEQAEAQKIQHDPEESAAFEALLQEAQRWHQFQILDKYLDALSKTQPKTPAFQKWLQWAKHRREIFDPINDSKTIME